MRGSARVLCLAMAAAAVGLAVGATRDSSGRHALPGSWLALPLEQTLLAILAGIVILLAAFSRDPRLQRLSCLLSTFLTIFASAVGGELWIQAIVIAFAMLGVLWLMADYWQSLDDRLVAARQRRLPRSLFAPTSTWRASQGTDSPPLS